MERWEDTPLYFGKARELRVGTERWTRGKARLYDKGPSLPETGSSCHHQFWRSKKAEGPWWSITHQRAECFRSNDRLFPLNRASTDLTRLDFKKYHWPSSSRFQHRSISIPKQPAITKISVVIAGLRFLPLIREFPFNTLQFKNLWTIKYQNATLYFNNKARKATPTFQVRQFLLKRNHMF